MAITPNLDFLARKSTLFLNNHTQQAICSPSRISLLTGKRPDYTKVYDLNTKMRDKKPNIVTLPQHFKAMGFTTAGVGKIFDPRGVDKKAMPLHGVFHSLSLTSYLTRNPSDPLLLETIKMKKSRLTLILS